MNERDNQTTDFINWLGFKKKIDFSNSKNFGRIIGFVLLLIGGIFLLSVLIIFIKFLFIALSSSSYLSGSDGSVIRNYGLVLVALLGSPFVVWRSIVAAKQVNIADEALFNDKIAAAANDLSARKEVTRSVTQDGKEVVLREWEDDLVARAAAINRLEGLALERKEISPRIVRLLATYVRGNFATNNLELTEPPFKSAVPRMDLQSAIDTIGRIHKSATEVDTGHWRLDLKECNFDGVNFTGGFFLAADFRDSRFEASKLNDGIFDGCIFNGCLLNFTDFNRSSLVGVKFNRIILNRPTSEYVSFAPSLNLDALRGATFIAADISALNYLGQPDVISETFATKDTIISENIRRLMLSDEEHDRGHTLLALYPNGNLTKSEKNEVKRFVETGFVHWSPYDSSDMATGFLLKEFYEKLDMKRWPYF